MAIDPAAVHELFTAETGPVVGHLRELAHRGEDIARTLAPRHTGHMLETITSGTGHDPFDGQPRGWWGAGYEAPIPHGRPWKGGFPVISALEARPGFVWNRSPAGRPHTRGTRGTHAFLTESLDLLSAEG